MDKVRFALVGCGKVSKKHIVSIQRIDNAELAAVCDIDIEAAKRVGENEGVPYFDNPHEMVDKVDFDVFSILTPSGTHAEVMLELAPYGKHFVIEKPMALRLEDADAMLEACRKYGIRLFVVQQNRFNLPIMKLREAIDSGRFGKLVLGTVRVRWKRTQEYYDEKPWRGTWAMDGGVLTNQASHHIDMLMWMMGEVESVMAKTATQLVDIETEDTGVVILKFTNGALGIIEATTATRPKDLEGSISILGEHGSVEIGGFFMNELKVWNFEPELPEDRVIFEKYGRNPDEFAWNHTQYLKDVVKNILKNEGGLVDGLEGRRLVELLNAIYESAETGREIKLKFKPQNSKLGRIL